MSFPMQLWLPSFHQQQQLITVIFCYLELHLQSWRRKKEGDMLGVQDLQTPIASQQSLACTTFREGSEGSHTWFNAQLLPS